jgi:tRNA-2-methylthio-N6-dimethylallyladenosine synthase/ribosomal protein S12 methylthiotransferase
MGRAGDGEAYLDLIGRVRVALPGAAVRSTFIAGFPGETDDDADELVAFVRAAGLSAAGVFAYDAQEGTPAAAMPGQVPPELAFARAARLGEAIDDVASAYWAGMAGQSVDVLVERGTTRADGVSVGRCALQAPDIDGRALLSGRRVRRGDLVRAVVTGSVGYDLEAVAGGPES